MKIFTKLETKSWEEVAFTNEFTNVWAAEMHLNVGFPHGNQSHARCEPYPRRCYYVDNAQIYISPSRRPLRTRVLKNDGTSRILITGSFTALTSQAAYLKYYSESISHLLKRCWITKIFQKLESTIKSYKNTQARSLANSVYFWFQMSYVFVTFKMTPL